MGTVLVKCPHCGVDNLIDLSSWFRNLFITCNHCFRQFEAKQEEPEE